MAADSHLARASERIAEKIGLHFPPERWTDLRRGLQQAAPEFGLLDASACSEWLANTTLSKAQWQLLATHLTVGETYFFRDKSTYETLATKVLPPLIHARRNGERRLRIWSAACCTGEEPYSLAILLSQVLPDFAQWNVTILGTDINERFLQKAAAGVYGEWSFRDAPPDLKPRYFRRLPNGRYAIIPEIKRRVTFAHLNLVEDVFPSLATDTNAMDLILCRNVLMYFSQPQMRKVIGNLRRALLDGGWLAVSPSEVSQAMFPGFQTENFPGVILYRKNEARTREDAGKKSSPFGSIDTHRLPAVPWTPPTLSPPPPPPPVHQALRTAEQFYSEGRFTEAVEILLSAKAITTAEEYSLLARALANQGQLSVALEWCDRWLAADKLVASAHYLRAMILQELGSVEHAGQALQRALYLEPKLILAHFALGNLARTAGRAIDAERHFANALTLLRTHPAEETLPESDGLKAERLMEIITSLTALETVP
jgi:chemotaxis protein methyltransferase CheR